MMKKRTFISAAHKLPNSVIVCLFLLCILLPNVSQFQLQVCCHIFSFHYWGCLQAGFLHALATSIKLLIDLIIFGNHAKRERLQENIGTIRTIFYLVDC